jgi:hypothetical protein
LIEALSVRKTVHTILPRSKEINRHFGEDNERFNEMGIKSGKQDANGERKKGEMKGKLDDDLDALFMLPLAEFTAARNTLAKRLKQEGRGNEAEFVKTLMKPSISAWAVNQLYWEHREAFDRLIAAGERFRQAQTSRLAPKVTAMRGALDARREALSNLSDLAAALLGHAGHNPTPDTIRRITTTLEALSAYTSLPDTPRPGRLVHDVDPPGFESLTSFIPSDGMKDLKAEPLRFPASQKSANAATLTKRKTEPGADITAAKASLQQAKSLLIEARSRLQSLEGAQKRANAETKEAEKRRLEAEERFEKARAASEDSARRLRSVALEVEKAARAVHYAKLTVDKISKEIDLLSRARQV